jgi:hypothetical protein
LPFPSSEPDLVVVVVVVVATSAAYSPFAFINAKQSNRIPLCCESSHLISLSLSLSLSLSHSTYLKLSHLALLSF